MRSRAKIGQRDRRRCYAVDVIPMLVGNLDAASSCNLENNRGVILVGVSIGVACVFKLNDITRTDSFGLPVNTSAPATPAQDEGGGP